MLVCSACEALFVELIICSKMCYLKIFRDFDELNDTFSRVDVSEESVARQQVEEDRLLYGSRPEPSDTVEVDEADKLANLPPKRSASEFYAAVGRPAKVRKNSDSKDFNYKSLTTVDWNNGSSPLDAWLNQSAIPSTIEDHSEYLPDPSDERNIARETEEIKVFRNVHIAIDSENPGFNPTFLENVSDLDLEAQMYYRKIMDNDKYPKLPIFLARRLAIANHSRAERLRHIKSKITEPHSDSSINTLDTFDAERADRFSRLAGLLATRLTGLERVARNLQNIDLDLKVTREASCCWQSAEQTERLHIHERRNEIAAEDVPHSDTLSWPTDMQSTEQYSSSQAAGLQKAQDPQHASTTCDYVPSAAPFGNDVDHAGNGAKAVGPVDNDWQSSPDCLGSSPPEKDFWAGVTSSYRSGSGLSHMSSANSPLHGSSIIDSEERDPHFQTRDRNPSYRSGSFSREARGLPLPPIELTKNLAFSCDICGRTVRVDRRLDWQ